MPGSARRRRRTSPSWHRWQPRNASFTPARGIVRAGLVQAPSRYRWSSAAAHLRGRDDALVQVAPLLQMASNWRHLLTSVIREEELKVLRAHKRTGRPLGDENVLALFEQNLGRIMIRQKPGPKNVQER